MNPARSALIITAIADDGVSEKQQYGFLDQLLRTIVSIVSHDEYNYSLLAYRVPVKDGHVIPETSVLPGFILMTLAVDGEASITEIIARLERAGFAAYSRSHMAHLLKPMRQAGLITRRRVSYEHVYTINPPAATTAPPYDARAVDA